VGAGLFARSLRNLRTLDAGINYENIIKFRIDAGSGYDTARLIDLHKQALSRLEALPGARSATMAIATPLTGGVLVIGVYVPGYASAPDENLNCNALVVGPRFFETMKMPLLTGRDFGPREDRPALSGQDGAASPNTPDTAADGRPQSTLSAVVNQSMARHFF